MLILVWLSVLLLFLLLGVFIFWTLRDDSRLSQTRLRATFFGGVVAFSLVFVGFTWNTLRVLPASTHANRLTPEVAAGKVAWQRYVCIDCHTILGNGAYYASDLTKSWNRFNARVGGNEQAARTAMATYLLHPPQATATTRGMPQFRMTQAEASSLVAFLKWTSEIDTNGWPPAPLRAATPAVAAVSLPENSAGAKLFGDRGCNACHSIGHGRIQGPDLAGIGARRDRATIIAFIQDPQNIYKRERHSPIDEGYPEMPSLEVPEGEAAQIADYLINTKVQP